MATASDIIKRLGGAAEVARFMGLSLSTVASWGDANFIPDWRRDKLLKLAKRKSEGLASDDFPTPDQRIPRAKPAEQQQAA